MHALQARFRNIQETPPLQMLWEVIFVSFYQFSLVCYNCSNNYEYVTGYGDKRVRVCVACYKEIRRIRKLKTRKWSIISSYFHNV